MENTPQIGAPAYFINAEGQPTQGTYEGSTDTDYKLRSNRTHYIHLLPKECTDIGLYPRPGSRAARYIITPIPSFTPSPVPSSVSPGGTGSTPTNGGRLSARVIRQRTFSPTDTVYDFSRAALLQRALSAPVGTGAPVTNSPTTSGSPAPILPAATAQAIDTTTTAPVARRATPTPAAPAAVAAPGSALARNLFYGGLGMLFIAKAIQIVITTMQSDAE